MTDTDRLAATLRAHFERQEQPAFLPHGDDRPEAGPGPQPVGKIDWSKVPWDKIAGLVIQIAGLFVH